MKLKIILAFLLVLYSGSLLAAGAYEMIKPKPQPLPPGFCDNVKKCGIVGTPGPKGDPGLAGPPGPQGLQGPVGPSGAADNIYFVTKKVKGRCGDNIVGLQRCGPATAQGLDVDSDGRFLPDYCQSNDSPIILGAPRNPPTFWLAYQASFIGWRVLPQGGYERCNVYTKYDDVMNYPECDVVLITGCTKTADVLP